MLNCSTNTCVHFFKEILLSSYPMVAFLQAGMDLARQFMVGFSGAVGVTVLTTDQVLWRGEGSHHISWIWCKRYLNSPRSMWEWWTRLFPPYSAHRPIQTPPCQSPGLSPASPPPPQRRSPLAPSDSCWWPRRPEEGGGGWIWTFWWVHRECLLSSVSCSG